MALRFLVLGLVLVLVLAVDPNTTYPTSAPTITTHAPSKHPAPAPSLSPSPAPITPPPSRLPSYDPTASPSTPPTQRLSPARTMPTPIPTMVPTVQTLSVREGYGLFIIFVFAMGVVLCGGAYYADADIKRMKGLATDASGPRPDRRERLPTNDTADDDGIEFSVVDGRSLLPLATKNQLQDPSRQAMFQKRQGEGGEY